MYKKFLICSLLVASGCHRDYDLHSVPWTLQDTALNQNIARAFDSGSVTCGEFASERWWDIFQDECLSNMIESAIATHPSIAIAEARIRLAEEKALRSASLLTPFVNFDGNINRQKMGRYSLIPPDLPDLFSEATVQLNAIYELDIWRKNRSLFAEKIDQARAAWADSVAVELLLSADIASYYFDLQGQIKRQIVAQNRLQKRKEFLNLVVSKYEKGISSLFQTLVARQEIVNIEKLLDDIEELLDRDKHALEALVGRSDIGIFADVSFERVPIPACLPLDLLARRPEIAAQKWRIEAAFYGMDVARADFYPNLNLLGFVGLDSLKLDRFFWAKSGEFLIEVATHLPIFDGGLRQAELGVKREETEIAISTYNQMILDAVREVSNWLTALEIADKNGQIVKEGLEAARENEKLHMQRYKTGLGNLESVLDAIDLLAVWEDLMIEIEVARLEAIVGLFKSIGGGYYECL